MAAPVRAPSKATLQSNPFVWDVNVVDFKGYNGSPNLKKSGVNVNFTQEMLDEWIKCAKDPIYFAEKYIKIVHVDHGLIPIQLYEYQKEVIDKFQKNRKNIVLQSRQSGKALALDTDIPLFSGGFKKIGEIEIGDVIIGNAGNPTTVTSSSEIHKKRTFDITFSDGSKITACADHIWEVRNSWNKNKKEILPTIDIFQNYKRNSTKKNPDGSLRQIQENKYYVENTAPIKYKKRDLLIDPYTLGVWLGDGESASGRLTCHVDDIPHYKNNGIEFTTDSSHSKRKNIWTSIIVDLHTKLKKYDLIKNKHIPDDYLYSSVEDRIALLQGLMDTDGYIQKRGTLLEFVQSKERKDFVLQVKQLIESLGITVYYKEKTNKKNNKDYCYLTFSVSFEQFPPFRLERKLSRVKASSRKSTVSRYIVDIQEVVVTPTKCLTVDNENHMFLCGRQYIPTHNTTTATVIILHFILFNKHKRVALLANKGDAALEIMSRIQLAYEYLPKWMQSGIVEWNKGSVELENGCSVIASATSGSAIRGKTVALLYIDETAFVENWDEFYTSVYPTISSGKNTKMLFTSTSNGLNHFYKFWIDAKEGRNGFAYTEVPWNRVPGRDEAWQQDTIASMSFDYEKFAQEFENEFLGSSGTLVAGSALKRLVHISPIYEWDGFCQYVVPDKKRSYIMVCDVSRGKGLDYSAFSVIDITQMPYIQVATYKSNTITPTDYAHVINKIGILYNNAGVLVENNDIGGQVADLLFDDLDYDNLLFTTSNGRAGKSLCGGGANAEPSIRTTTSVKAKGCSVLKLLIEQQQLVINDFNTINELSRFSKKGKSYEAEDGNDDMVMSLVLFSWCTTQPYFANLTDENTLQKLRDNDSHFDDFVPFGFIVDGREDEEVEVDNQGNVWKKTEAWSMNY